jgi:hypothetical protein
MQTMLPRPKTCESTIFVVCKKKKLEYKFHYLSGCVQPKVVMKALHDLYKTPIYKEV